MVDFMLMWSFLLILPVAVMIFGMFSAAFSVVVDDRQSFLNMLASAAGKIGYSLQDPAQDRLDRLLLRPKAFRRWKNLMGHPDISVTLTHSPRITVPWLGLPDRSEAVIAGPFMLVRHIQKAFPGGASLPSPGSLGVPWRGLFFWLAVWAAVMSVIAMIFALD
jgi:hypothetical protein